MGSEAARAAWESSAGSRPSIPAALGELRGRRAGPGVAGPGLHQPGARRWPPATRRRAGLKQRERRGRVCGAAGAAGRARAGPGGPGGQPRRCRAGKDACRGGRLVGDPCSDSASGRSTPLLRIGSFTDAHSLPLFNYIINLMKGWIRVPLVQCPSLKSTQSRSARNTEKDSGFTKCRQYWLRSVP